ncbi:MAG: hypothetical protein PVI75_06305 [Gammaproteobacteria bacterium]|jgi:hypothetical protein
MNINDAKTEINTSPKNSPKWLKQCYKIVCTTSYTQNQTLEKIYKILKQQNIFNVKKNINMLNKYKTNLLWAAAVNGKSKVVDYLIKKFDATPTNSKFEFSIVNDIDQLSIMDMVALCACPTNKKANYLETFSILAKKMKVSLCKYKLPTLAEYHIPYVGNIVINTPEWFHKEFNKQKKQIDKQNKIKIIPSTKLFDIKMTFGQNENTKSTSLNEKQILQKNTY